jgi:hypothetical protein
MPYHRYDFKRFIDQVKDKDYPEIVKYAEAELGRVEHSSRGVRGAPRRRELGSLEYADKVGQFLFFMRRHIIPDDVDEFDRQLYRVVVEQLVNKGQLKPEVLDVFSDAT